jgi:hypothetical protein
LATPPNIAWTVQGARGRTSASSTHSCGPAPLPCEDQVYGRK